MAPLRLLLATRSADKVREIRFILAFRRDLELVSLEDLGVAPDPEEDHVEAFDTFRENAHAKAAYFLRKTGLATVADDSGIEVDALERAPGVRSRRFAAAPGLSGLALDQANNRLLLEKLAATPDARRTARYVCAAVLVTPDGHTTTALGTCYGRILRAPRGSGGFGYDPLFLVESEGKTFGELGPDEKHRHSHRARAFRALFS